VVFWTNKSSFGTHGPMDRARGPMRPRQSLRFRGPGPTASEKFRENRFRWTLFPLGGRFVHRCSQQKTTFWENVDPKHVFVVILHNSSPIVPMSFFVQIHQNKKCGTPVRLIWRQLRAVNSAMRQKNKGFCLGRSVPA